MIRVDFKKIKNNLIPNPKACHDVLRKMLVSILIWNYDV
jgi:hypothetical protein